MYMSTDSEGMKREKHIVNRKCKVLEGNTLRLTRTDKGL